MLEQKIKISELKKTIKKLYKKSFPKIFKKEIQDIQFAEYQNIDYANKKYEVGKNIIAKLAVLNDMSV